MKNTSTNSNNNFSIADSDVMAEWIYFAVLANHDTESIIQLIKLTLASTFLEQPIISEAEIDEAIKMDLEMLQQQADNAHLTEQDLDRAKIKQELIEVGAGEQFEEGLAACQFLAALLGSPTDGFLAVIANYGEEFADTFSVIAKQYNVDRLRTLTPKALDVIIQSKNSEPAKVMGLSDPQSWFASLVLLEANLH
ncbi:MAG: hypothetical protein COA63_009400 [Methylophaga sp.]|nr:hypothetical protein [Methylophaga sp.]